MANDKDTIYLTYFFGIDVWFYSVILVNNLLPAVTLWGWCVSVCHLREITICSA